ncbi:importin subunit alpha-4 [Anaeramoeba ignava]|uniref:Importin subunit alpha n=1 Tax=Anaeramoeba ignava TaxID=1746090 RepID=A0A9Q0R967_ANAIG|nr:importin subunit alpha-4 [Anaeramoeba ignava]
MDYSQRLSQRKSKFKSKFNINNQRNKRFQTCVKISKSKKDDQLMKKRYFLDEKNYENKLSSLNNLNQMIANLIQFSEFVEKNEEEIINSLTELRKLLLKIENPPIYEMVSSGIFPVMIKLLKQSIEQIQFEVLWILTIFSTESIEELTQNDLIECLMKLLYSTNEQIQEQAVWVISNIVADSPKNRDIIIEKGVLSLILNFLVETNTLQNLRTISWTISNFCNGNPKPDFEKIKIVLPFLKEMIYYVDHEIILNSSRAFIYLTNSNPEQIQECINLGILPRIVSFLKTSNLKLISNALHIINNITAGNDEQTQLVINQNSLPVLHRLLSSPHASIRKEVCWILSNITAGNQSQVISVIETPNLIQKIVEILNSDEFEVRKEALYSISNILANISFEQAKFLLDLDFISPICNLLSFNDPPILFKCLSSILSILQFGELFYEEKNQFVSFIEEIGGIEKIRILENHEISNINEIAQKIIEKYFNFEEIDNN